VQKISRTTMQLWARLLAEVPNSRLLIKSPILHDDSARRLLTQALRSAGIPAHADKKAVIKGSPVIKGSLPFMTADKKGSDPFMTGRVELVGRSRSMVEHMNHYERVDVALDTTPYNGTTTTCDALWMGVPVVTLACDRHLSRVGVSLLNNAGLGDLVATSADEYVAIAANLARDVERRRALRSGLRQQLTRSPLMDGRAFAAAVEAALREAWREMMR
jgi:predicted O-linked N-acetylglucosamine transferase (SPINDLY family)